MKGPTLAHAMAPIIEARTSAPATVVEVVGVPMAATEAVVAEVRVDHGVPAGLT